ncbi:hypothetical protein D9M68_918590 [compost metagenome]
MPGLLCALGDASQDPPRDLIAPMVEDQLRKGLGVPSALRRCIDDFQKLPSLEAFDAPPGGQRAHPLEQAFLRGVEVRELDG